MCVYGRVRVRERESNGHATYCTTRIEVDPPCLGFKFILCWYLTCMLAKLIRDQFVSYVYGVCMSARNVAHTHTYTRHEEPRNPGRNIIRCVCFLIHVSHVCTDTRLVLLVSASIICSKSLFIVNMFSKPLHDPRRYTHQFNCLR